MNTQPRVLKWSLIVGIVIVLNLFFNYAISLAYKSPDYNAYCPQSMVMPNPSDAAAEQAYEQAQTACSNNFQAAQNIYSRNIFTALLVLGVLMVIIGNFFKGNAVISNSLSIGGVLSFIIASMRYWGAANDLIHVVILAIALALLLWLALKKFKNTSTNSA